MIESLQLFALVDALLNNWDTIRVKLGASDVTLVEELSELGLQLSMAKSPNDITLLLEDTLDLLEETPAYDYVHGLIQRSQIGIETKAQTRGGLIQITADGPPPVELAEAGVVSGRMLGNALSDDTEPYLVKLYFGTNREQGSDTEEFFTGAHRAWLTYGFAEVTIPVARHRLGRVEKRAWWNRLHDKDDPRRYVVLGGVDTFSQGDFTTQLAENESTANELLVFIHGYNVTFEEAAHRAAQFSYDMNFEGHVLLFSWPSQGQFASYLVDEERAAVSADHFHDFLQALEDGPWQKIHLVAHSMGNRVMLHGLAARSWPNSKIGQVVFIAADIYVDVFEQKFAKIKDVGSNYSSYVSKSDRALLASRILHQGNRIGYKKGEPFVTTGLETIDASGVNTSLLGLGHSYFGAKRSVLKDLSLLIREKMSAESRGLRRSSDTKYWFFPK